MFTLIINEEYFINNSPLQWTVDYKKILNSARWVQEETIQDLLGTALYDEVVAKVTDGTIVDGAEYEELYTSFILPIMMNLTLNHSVSFLAASFTAKGIVEKTGDNSTSVSEKMISHLEARFLDIADSKLTRARLWLCGKHSDGLFPLYNNNNNTDVWDSQSGNQSRIAGGIFLKQKRT